MATNCCGCSIEQDYGTTIIVGDGSDESPFTISRADPAYVRPAVRVRRTTNQSITPSGTANVISFDTEVFDSANMWVIGSPTLITIPQNGLYIFGGAGIWTANATGTRELSIRRNGTQILITNDNPPNSVNGGTTTLYHTISYQQNLGVGDTLELLARQESGGSLNMLAEVEGSIVFWAFYVGRFV